MRKFARFTLNRASRMAAFVACFTLVFGSQPITRAAASTGNTGAGAKAPGVAPVTRAAAAALQSPAAMGQWGPIQMWPDIPVHISLLPSGKFLFWGRDKSAPPDPHDVELASNAYVWDPFYNTFKTVRNTRTNLFCSGHSFLPDGTLFVAGGHEIMADNTGQERYDVESVGSRHTNFFDYKTETWSAGPDMRLPRWYPSVVTHRNGETQIVSGNFVTGFSINNTPLGGINRDTEILGLDRTLRNTPNHMPNSLPNYPFVHMGPNGKVLVSSGTSFTGLLYDPPSNSWSTHGNLFLRELHDQGTSVMYDRGKVIVIGGRQGQTAVTSHTELIDLTQPSPIWTTGPAMNFPRYFATSVLMPNGQVFVVGGSRCGGRNNLQSADGACTNGAIMNPEIYTPSTGQWSIMAAQQVIRMYHSVAVLMPDARIMVAGGGRPGAFGENGFLGYDPVLAHKEVEIFSPPYLFNPSDGTPATRPAITSAPSRIAYQQGFSVGVGNIPAGQIGQVVLVRLPSVTHGLNFEQRRLPLTFTAQGEHSLTVTGPADNADCPPGPYMLFVLTQSGVPSVARILFVDNTAISSDKAAFPASSLTAQVMKGTIQVSTQPGVSWQVTGVPSWITITSATSGTGSGAVTYDVQNHTGVDPRSATMLVAGLPYTIRQGAEFADVSINHQFHDFIGKIYAAGITGGCSGGGGSLRNFCPGDNVPRWQMAVFLISSLGIVPPAGQPNPFPADVVAPNPPSVPGTPGYDFIIELWRRGITSGCAAQSFCPHNLVTRAEMAVFIERAIGVTSPPQLTPQIFTDVPPGFGGVFYDYINDFFRRGFTSGCFFNQQTGERGYCPSSNISRGEMAVFLSRAAGL